MSTRAKWLLVAILGLMIHITLIGFGTVTLSQHQNNPSMKAMVIPYGQLNYSDMTSAAAIEFLLLFALWVVFAFTLLRDRN